MKNLLYLVSILFVFAFLLFLPGKTLAQESVMDFPELRGPYLGQKPPGLKPEIFAPGIISTDLHEGSSGFNLNSTHFVFQRIEDNKLFTYEMERKNEQWTKPKIVPFAHMMIRGKGKSDLYKSHFIKGEYTEAENLGNVFNTEEHEWDPFIAPDESCLIFCSTKLGGYGEDDFYISFRNEDLSWSKPVNMGEEINSKGSENRAYITVDGKYFFFTSTKRGNRDIYWADAKIIKKLKPEEKHF